MSSSLKVLSRSFIVFFDTLPINPRLQDVIPIRFGNSFLVRILQESIPL